MLIWVLIKTTVYDTTIVTEGEIYYNETQAMIMKENLNATYAGMDTTVTVLEMKVELC